MRRRKRKNRFLEEERELNKMEEIRLERLKFNERLKIRDIEPAGFLPVSSIDTLEKKSSENKYFCENTSISSKDENFIIIHFNISGFNFINSTFYNVMFDSSANLTECDFRNAKFGNVVFSKGANLSEVDFSEADLNDVTFEDGCNLKGCIFSNSKFKKASIFFDRNYLRGAKFHFRRNDPWHQLSASFAGVWQYINLSLSGLYFVIIIMKIYVFEFLSKITNNFTDVDSHQISAGDFVFGSGFSSYLIALLILFYQSLRIFLTTQISPLIEEEKGSCYTPEKDHYMRYSMPTRVMKITGIVVLSLFFYEMWSIWSQPPINVPTNFNG